MLSSTWKSFGVAVACCISTPLGIDVCCVSTCHDHAATPSVTGIPSSRERCHLPRHFAILFISQPFIPWPHDSCNSARNPVQFCALHTREACVDQVPPIHDSLSERPHGQARRNMTGSILPAKVVRGIFDSTTQRFLDSYELCPCPHNRMIPDGS